MTAQPLPPGRIRAAFAPITRPAYCTCDPAADPHRHVVHVDTYDATVTDRTDATDAEFEARLERLDRLEVADVDTVERVARAICESEDNVPWDEWPEYVQETYRGYARAAIDALKPAPGTDSSGQAVQRDKPRRFRECAEAFGIDGEYDPRCCRFPKSCSPYPYAEAIAAGNVADDDLEPPPDGGDVR